MRRPAIHTAIVVTDRSRSSRPRPEMTKPQKEKGPTRVGPKWGLNSCDRPEPDDPGGLGAEESGTERTGPTHDLLFAIQRGSRWAEVWRHYDSANDRVTPCFQALAARDRSPGAPTNSRPPAFHGGTRRQGPLRPCAVGAIM